MCMIYCGMLSLFAFFKVSCFSSGLLNPLRFAVFDHIHIYCTYIWIHNSNICLFVSRHLPTSFRIHLALTRLICSIMGKSGQPNFAEFTHYLLFWVQHEWVFFIAHLKMKYKQLPRWWGNSQTNRLIYTDIYKR